MWKVLSVKSIFYFLTVNDSRQRDEEEHSNNFDEIHFENFLVQFFVRQTNGEHLSTDMSTSSPPRDCEDWSIEHVHMQHQWCRPQQKLTGREKLEK